MKLTEKLLISDVQRAFTNRFPLLDIKFYTNAHRINEGSNVKEEIKGDMPLGVVSANMNAGEINFIAGVTASELELEFEKKYGLHVQVFRKSGDSYLQTSKTDYWSLGKHQQMAEESVKEY